MKVQDTFSMYNPIVNLIFFLGAFIFGMIFMHPVYLIVAVVSSLSYYIYLKREMVIKFILGILLVFLVISIVNPIFNTRGNTILFKLGSRPYTLEAFYYGMAVGAMFVCVIAWFASYNKVFTSDKLTYLFGNIIPSISLVFTMILRLLPSYRKKIKAIKNARSCIGKGGENGAPKDRIKNGMIVISSLTSWALEDSIITADSMKSRGYGSSKRSNFCVYRFTGRDKIIIGVMLVLIIIISICGIKGGMKYTFLPDTNFENNIFTIVGAWSYLLFLNLPIVINITEDIKWHFLKSKI